MLRGHIVPKHPRQDITSDIHNRLFFGENYLELREKINTFTWPELCSLVSSLSSLEARYTGSSINLSCVSLLINACLSERFKSLITIDDRTQLCLLLDMLVEFQKAERTRKTLDPKAVILWLLNVSTYHQRDVSTYAIAILRRAYESGLLHGSQKFICNLRGPLYNLTLHDETYLQSQVEEQRRDYLNNLIYLFEEGVLRAPRGKKHLLSLRQALHTSTTPVMQGQVSENTVAFARVSSHEGPPILKKMRYGVVLPPPILTHTAISGPVGLAAPVLTSGPQRELTPLERARAKKLAQFSKITEAFSTGNPVLLERLFEEMNVDVKISPTHAQAAPGHAAPVQAPVAQAAPMLTNTPRHRVHFFGTTPSPTNAQGSDELRVAANLIADYFRRKLNVQERAQFSSWIKRSNAQFFSTLFAPFRTNRKLFYTLMEEGRLNQVIAAIPIIELASFIQCLAGERGLRIKESADSLIRTLSALTDRLDTNPAQATSLEPIFRDLVTLGRIYHTEKNSFAHTRGHPQVLVKIQEEEVEFNAILRRNQPLNAPGL